MPCVSDGRRPSPWTGTNDVRRPRSPRFYQRAYESRSQRLGSEHRDTLDTWLNRAAFFEAKGCREGWAGLVLVAKEPRNEGHSQDALKAWTSQAWMHVLRNCNDLSRQRIKKMVFGEIIHVSILTCCSPSCLSTLVNRNKLPGFIALFRFRGSPGTATVNTPTPHQTAPAQPTTCSLAPSVTVVRRHSDRRCTNSAVAFHRVCLRVFCEKNEIGSLPRRAFKEAETC